MPDITDSVQYLKGVGEKRAALYRKLGVDSICSLLRFFPRTYVDYSAVVPVAEASIGETVCVEVTIFRKGPEQRIRKGLSIFRAFATDGSTDLTITIYNNKFQFAALKTDHPYRLYGVMKGTLLRKEMQSPQIFRPRSANGADSAGLSLDQRTDQPDGGGEYAPGAGALRRSSGRGAARCVAPAGTPLPYALCV